MLAVSGNMMAGNCCVLCVERFPLQSSPALLADRGRPVLPTPKALRAVPRCSYLHPCPLCSPFYLFVLRTPFNSIPLSQNSLAVFWFFPITSRVAEVKCLSLSCNVFSGCVRLTHINGLQQTPGKPYSIL